MDSPPEPPVKISPEATAVAQDSLLLHSMVNYRSVLEPLLKALSPKSICEVGVEGGLTTRFLLDFCAEREIGYVGIDPAAPAPARQLVSEVGQTFLAEPSLDALGTLPPCGAYFLDGDHNYYTVYHELRAILETFQSGDQAGRGLPCMFLHDIGWPCARRDMYYDPTRIPAEFLLEHDWNLGALPGRDGLSEHGYRSKGEFAIATREGGPRNGVLTALEDVLNESKHNWEFFTVPVLFGLGVLYDPATLDADNLADVERIRQTVESSSDLLGLMERNRLDLFMKILKLQDELEVIPELHRVIESGNEHIKNLETDIVEIEADRVSLHQKIKEQHEYIVEMTEKHALDDAKMQCSRVDAQRLRIEADQWLGEVTAIKASRSYRLARIISRVMGIPRLARKVAKRILRGGPGVPFPQGAGGG